METAIEIIGARIKSYRTHKKMSQERLAELSNLHTTYIGQIERGEKNPSLLSLLKISNALEISPENLIARLGEIRETGQPVANQAYELFLSLGEEEGRELLDIIFKIIHYKGV